MVNDVGLVNDSAKLINIGPGKYVSTWMGDRLGRVNHLGM